ncbi:MAG: hypothetical protein RLZ10_194 [Bacteroidota bacterium]|jgi:hypothetical protein
MENNSKINYQGNSDYFLQIITTLVKNTYNDQDLGAKIRTIVNSMSNNNVPKETHVLENDIQKLHHDAKK